MKWMPLIVATDIEFLLPNVLRICVGLSNREGNEGWESIDSFFGFSIWEKELLVFEDCLEVREGRNKLERDRRRQEHWGYRTCIASQASGPRCPVFQSCRRGPRRLLDWVQVHTYRLKWWFNNPMLACKCLAIWYIEGQKTKRLRGKKIPWFPSEKK